MKWETTADNLSACWGNNTKPRNDTRCTRDTRWKSIRFGLEARAERPNSIDDDNWPIDSCGQEGCQWLLLLLLLLGKESLNLLFICVPLESMKESSAASERQKQNPTTKTQSKAKDSNNNSNINLFSFFFWRTNDLGNKLERPLRKRLKQQTCCSCNSSRVKISPCSGDKINVGRLEISAWLFMANLCCTVCACLGTRMCVCESVLLVRLCVLLARNWVSARTSGRCNAMRCVSVCSFFFNQRRSKRRFQSGQLCSRDGQAY